MSYHNGSIWPHDNALIALGFDRYGLKDAVLQLLTALFEASLRRFQRLPNSSVGFARTAHGPTFIRLLRAAAWGVSSRCCRRPWVSP
jgi:glycogen debranching enzyme